MLRARGRFSSYFLCILQLLEIQKKIIATFDPFHCWLYHYNNDVLGKKTLSVTTEETLTHCHILLLQYAFKANALTWQRNQIFFYIHHALFKMFTFMLPIICLSNNALKLYIYNLQIKEIGSKEQVEDDALVRCDVQDSDERYNIRRKSKHLDL